MSREIIGQVGLLLGAVLVLVAAIGVVRFPSPLTRMHALSKASTAGVSLAMLGAAITLSSINDVMSLVFATLFQAATNPVSSTLLTQATYYAEGISNQVGTVDELAEAIANDDIAGV